MKNACKCGDCTNPLGFRPTHGQLDFSSWEFPLLDKLRDEIATTVASHFIKVLDFRIGPHGLFLRFGDDMVDSAPISLSSVIRYELGEHGLDSESKRIDGYSEKLLMALKKDLTKSLRIVDRFLELER